MKLDGERVRGRRERLALSIEDASTEARVSPHTWLRAERGEEIRPSSLRRIAEALSVEPGQLLGKTPVEERVDRARLGQLFEFKDDNPEEIGTLLEHIPLPKKVQRKLGQDPTNLTPEDRRNLRRLAEAAEEWRLAIKRLETEVGRERQE